MSLLHGLESHHCRVVSVDTGAKVLESLRRVQPDVIVVHDELPDMPGADLCQLLHGEVGAGPQIPSVLLTRDEPTAEVGVAALRAGAWDVFRVPSDHRELTVKLQIYARAKRNIELALADAPAHARSRLHSRAGLARRAREIGGLLARLHEPLACVVFVVEPHDEGYPAGLLLRAVRVSDVVGVLSPNEFAVLAPATNDGGAAGLARRVGAALNGAMGGAAVGGASLIRIGYAVLPNLKYAPIDPIELLPRASVAVRHGRPEPDTQWIRAFQGPLV